MSQEYDHYWKVTFRAFDMQCTEYYPIEMNDKDIHFRLKYITDTYVFIKKRKVKFKKKPWNKKKRPSGMKLIK